MPSGEQSQPNMPDDSSEPNASPSFADTIDENDPHKVEKLANVGKDTDAAKDSE